MPITSIPGGRGAINQVPSSDDNDTSSVDGQGQGQAQAASDDDTVPGFSQSDSMDTSGPQPSIAPSAAKATKTIDTLLKLASDIQNGTNQDVYENLMNMDPSHPSDIPLADGGTLPKELAAALQSIILQQMAGPDGLGQIANLPDQGTATAATDTQANSTPDSSDDQSGGTGNS
jgi:hypothetical protein